MTACPAVYNWQDLSAGMVVSLPLKISADDMDVFSTLSGDRSRIHHDAPFARKNGFDQPVVYGALIIAHLSELVGMHLPGDLGLATGWTIDFHNPLYVDEAAEFQAELVHVSEGTRTVKIRFKVFAGEKLVAAGSAGSKILEA